MKKFRCVVTKTNVYEIEMDETVLNEDFMKAYKDTFDDLDTLEEHAENIAQYKARHENSVFIEGYGVPLLNGKEPLFFGEDAVNKAININIISKDIDVETKEVK